MADLHQLSKDYFKKNPEERLELIQEVYTEIENEIQGNEFSRDVIIKTLTIFIKDSENKEDYEIAGFIKEIKDKLNK
jgi:hypothetical protein